MEYLAAFIRHEDADALTVIEAGRGAVVVDRGPVGYRISRERNS